MASIAALLATDAGNRCLRTFYRVASVLLAEWIFHFLYPGSCWCWVLYENGKKKRLFDFASWLIFVSMTNIVYPKLLMTVQKVEMTWAESEAGRNVLCLSKIFGLRIIWQVIGGLMIGAGMRGKHQLHHYVRSDVQLMFGHVAALAFLITTFWQSDLVDSADSDCIKLEPVTSHADFNESDNDVPRPRPFGYRPMFNVNGSAINRGVLRPPTRSPFRMGMPTGLQKPLGSRSPSPNMFMGSVRVSVPAPRKRAVKASGGKRNNNKPRKRQPSGVNSLNSSSVKQIKSKIDDQWAAWNASHHHDHKHEHHCNAAGACGSSSSRYAKDDGDTDTDADADIDIDAMWSNRSSCNNHCVHCPVHQCDPAAHMHSVREPSDKRAGTGCGCSSGYG